MGTFLKVTSICNLGKDVEIRYTPSGVAVANFSAASTRNFKKNDEFQEETHWQDFTVWGKQAERSAEALHKGSTVYVEGYLKTDKWEDKEGVTRYRTNCIVQRIDFLSNYNKPDSDGSSYDSGNSRPPAQSPSDDDIPF